MNRIIERIATLCLTLCILAACTEATEVPTQTQTPPPLPSSTTTKPTATKVIATKPALTQTYTPAPLVIATEPPPAPPSPQQNWRTARGKRSWVLGFPQTSSGWFLPDIS